MHILTEKSKCIGESTGRERERKRDVCVSLFLNFIIFLTLRSCTYFKILCRSLQKILIIRDALELLYYNINWKSKSAFAQMESESVLVF